MSPTQQQTSRGGNGWLIAAGLAAATPVIIGLKWIVYSTFEIDHHLLLLPAIEADQQTLTTEGAGTLNVYTDRSADGPAAVIDPQRERRRLGI